MSDWQALLRKKFLEMANGDEKRLAKCTAFLNFVS